MVCQLKPAAPPGPRFWRFLQGTKQESNLLRVKCKEKIKLNKPPPSQQPQAVGLRVTLHR